IPSRASPASGSRCAAPSATTRETIAPTVRHAIRNNCSSVDFEVRVASHATRTSKSTLEQFLRIAWRTVGAIVSRVVAEGAAQRDPLAGLARIGIDEISYKRGHRYITLVVDHDSGRLVWAAPGRDRKTLAKFFDALGETRCAAITHVSADAATATMAGSNTVVAFPITGGHISLFDKSVQANGTPWILSLIHI